MKQWKLLLTSNGEDLWEAGVKREIFQGDIHSTLLFVLSTVLCFFSTIVDTLESKHKL